MQWIKKMAISYQPWIINRQWLLLRPNLDNVYLRKDAFLPSCVPLNSQLNPFRPLGTVGSKQSQSGYKWWCDLEAFSCGDVTCELPSRAQSSVWRNVRTRVVSLGPSDLLLPLSLPGSHRAPVAPGPAASNTSLSLLPDSSNLADPGREHLRQQFPSNN